MGLRLRWLIAVLLLRLADWVVGDSMSEDFEGSQE
jgi:hypothetical protein